MCDLAGVLALMEEKSRLLRSIEDVTQEMISCSFEQLEARMIQRNKLVEQLKKADEEMKELCDGPEGGAALDAAVCKGEPDRYSGKLSEIYRAGQGHRAILRRLKESEMQAVLRMKQEQLDILEKIKTTGQSGAAKASRFFSVGSSQGGFSRLGKA